MDDETPDVRDYLYFNLGGNRPDTHLRLVIQCPSCGNTDLEHINLCELAPTLWPFNVIGNRIIVETGSGDTVDYEENTRHLYCQKCSTEWKVPTLAEVEWE